MEAKKHVHTMEEEVEKVPLYKEDIIVAFDHIKVWKCKCGYKYAAELEREHYSVPEKLTKDKL